MNTESAITPFENSTDHAVQIVLDSLSSENSKRAYRKALNDFFDWHKANGSLPITKALVQRYKPVLQESGLAPSTINLRMSAIRKLAQEAADNGIVDHPCQWHIQCKRS